MAEQVQGRDSRFRLREFSPLLDDWVRQSTQTPARPTIGAIVSVLLCTTYQTFYIARLLFDGSPVDDHAYTFTREWYGALATAIVVIGAAALLILRSRRPLTILAIECLLYAAASTVGMTNYLLFPLLFALFSCVARPPARQTVVGIGLVWAVMTFSAAITHTPTGFAPEYLGQLMTALATVALAVATRSVHGWQQSRKHALTEERHARQLTLQRDRAVSHARIAAELHDSVGHGLTTIIALAEGLSGTVGDPDIDEALSGINSVARESLEDTRQAVRALADAESQHDSAQRESTTDRRASGSHTQESVPVLHSWAEIGPLLTRVRSLGVTAVFTETGRRPTNEAHADLCFSVTREAITNAIRHSSDLRYLSVSWNHEPAHATAVSVRSTAAPTAEDRPGRRESSPPGTGLSRLQADVERRGGGMSYGWTAEYEWTVKAFILSPDRIPPVTGASTDAREGETA